jgi:hypothetical protein
MHYISSAFIFIIFEIFERLEFDKKNKQYELVFGKSSFSDSRNVMETIKCRTSLVYVNRKQTHILITILFLFL